MNRKLAIFSLAVSLSASLLGAQSPAAMAADSVTTIRSGDGDTLRAIFYEHADFTGAQLRYYGGSACTATTSDADFSLGVIPSAWNDRISSIRDYNSCDVKIYKGSPFAGDRTGYINYGTAGQAVPSGYNDTTSSFRVS